MRKQTFLNKLISLKDQKSFIDALKSGKLPEFFRGLTGYKVVSAADLDLDDEGRIYKENIDFEEMILDMPELAIRNSRTISLCNCILLGNLSLGGKESPRQITMDNCLVIGTLYITGNDKEPDLEVQIWQTNCTILKIGSNNIRALDIGASNIHDFQFYNAKCESLEMTSNRIRYLRIDEVDVVRCNFFHGQVDLATSFPPDLTKQTREVTDIDLNARSHTLLDFSLEANKYSQSAFETLSFLRERTLISGDQRSISELRYRAALLSQSRLSRTFVRFTHAFESPVRFAAYGGVVLLVAALLYWTKYCGFVHGAEPILGSGGYQLQSRVSWGLRLPEALYFSCITFTTIGYGDLAPIGLARFIAVVEGLLGITLVSSFVVALVKRYVEK